MSQKSSTATVVKEQIQDAGLGMDLITFEVMRNAFVAACYEASTTIERIAYHPVIGMGRDRSNAILTPDARLVAHGHTDAACAGFCTMFSTGTPSCPRRRHNSET